MVLKKVLILCFLSKSPVHSLLAHLNARCIPPALRATCEQRRHSPRGPRNLRHRLLREVNLPTDTDERTLSVASNPIYSHVLRCGVRSPKQA